MSNPLTHFSLHQSAHLRFFYQLASQFLSFRSFTSFKVFTLIQESLHLKITKTPHFNLEIELLNSCWNFQKQLSSKRLSSKIHKPQLFSLFYISYNRISISPHQIISLLPTPLLLINSSFHLHPISNAKFLLKLFSIIFAKYFLLSLIWTSYQLNL